MEPPNIVLAQAVELPDFSGLPLYAQGILYTVLAVGLALSILIPRFGFLHGKETATKTSNPDPLVAAVVVDNTALNAHTEAVREVAKELGLLRIEIMVTREVNQSLRKS